MQATGADKAKRESPYTWQPDKSRPPKENKKAQLPFADMQATGRQGKARVTLHLAAGQIRKQ